jgi:hypothetical protein
METATRKSKKVDKRETFTEVFERQSRRFSAFDLLGIEPSPSSLSSPKPMNSREGDSKELFKEIDVGNLELDVTDQSTTNLSSHLHETESLSQVHRTDSGSTFNKFSDKDNNKEGQSNSQLVTQRSAGRGLNALGPNTDTYRERTGSAIHSSSVDHRPDHASEEHRTEGQSYIVRPNGQTLAFGVDSTVQHKGPDGPELLGSDPSEGHTVQAKRLGRRVRSNLGQTNHDLGQTIGLEVSSLLGIDGPSVALRPDKDAIILAPLQWQVWQLLQTVTDAQVTTSYRKIAKQIKSTIEGVRKAIRIIQKEGGFLTKEVVRTADEQGVRLTINPQARFRRGTLNEAKGILKRGLHLERTPPGPIPVHRTDGLGMYVCNNLNIRQTDVVKLLRIPPVEWKIREQTLLQIAEALPEMTALEFKLSLTYLVEQAKTAKEPVRHPNAWIKAAFEKNGGPLVTEREIETRFSHPTAKSEASQRHNLEREVSHDLDLMRRYLACAPEDRSTIDDLAEHMAAPLLKIVSDDKKPGILEEARLSALKEFFGSVAKFK